MQKVCRFSVIIFDFLICQLGCSRFLCFLVFDMAEAAADHHGDEKKKMDSEDRGNYCLGRFISRKFLLP